MIWRFRSRTLDFRQVRIVGILNVTPDSFSDGGRFFSGKKAVERALEMEREGADVIDIGGESTRPGAKPVSAEEEMKRVVPVIRAIRSRTEIPISIDTTKSVVARAALEAGADIINDVDGLSAAEEMAALTRESKAGLVLMHRRGTPETMQSLAQYDDVVREVFQELRGSLERVVRTGVDPEQIVLDPGIGFAKTAEQNLELIAGLHEFQAWGRPVLVGPSRKSFIGCVIEKDPEGREWGSAAAVSLCVAHGAGLIRVHSVAAMRDVIRISQAISRKRGQTYVWS